MNSALSIGLSGLNAASARMSVSAHNIANAQTPGFTRQEVAQSGLAEGGVTVSISSAVSPEEAPMASLTQDMVDQTVAAYAFKANLKVIQTQQQLLGLWLDEKA